MLINIFWTESGKWSPIPGYQAGGRSLEGSLWLFAIQDIIKRDWSM